MSFSLDIFYRAKQEVQEQFMQLNTIFQNRSDIAKQKHIEKIAQELEIDDFMVSVVGAFGNGKSAFINALLGKRVLPSLPRTTTSILNVITYGEKPEIYLHYYNKKKEPEKTSEKAFKKLIAIPEPERGDKEAERKYRKEMEFQSSIEFAEIKYPLSICENGVRIIDTPGTNDLDPDRDKLTSSIIPKSDAAIVVLRAVPLLSESEHSFIRDRLLKSDIHKLFLVINFKDVLETPEDEAKILQRAHDELSDIIEHPKVHLLSADQALKARRKAAGESFNGDDEVMDIEDTGILEFENDLANFLQYDRGRVKIKKPVHKAIKAIEQTIGTDIAREKAIFTKDIHDNREKITTIHKQLEQMQELGQESLRKIDISFQQKRKNLIKWYEFRLKGLSRTAMDIAEFNAHLPAESINRKIEGAVAPIEKQINEDKKKIISSLVAEVVEEASVKVKKEWGRIDGELNELIFDEADVPSLHVEVKGQSKEENMFTGIYDELEEAWDTSEGFLGKAAIATSFVITSAIDATVNLTKKILNFFFGNKQQENKEEKIRREVRMQFQQLERTRTKQLKGEWDSIQQSVKRSHQHIIDEKVLETEHQLCILQQNVHLEEREVKQKMVELENQITQLKTIKDSLLAIEQRLQMKEAMTVI